MSDSHICKRCGHSVSAGLDFGRLCPACVLQEALATEPTSGSGLPGGGLPCDFGGYVLLEEIGRGGMGVVYRARQIALGREVAVKLLLSGVYAGTDALRRFQREAEAAARLQHPGIVTVHDFGECGGQPYYVMDLVAGRDLAAMCEGRPLPVGRAAEIVRRLCDAMSYAHARGVLHRDLKPSNVLIDGEGQPRIADFGLAKVMELPDGVTVTGQMLGSPAYSSPEQAAGRVHEAGIACDVYGLGALLYHLVTGRAPYSAASPAETLRLVMETDPPPPRLLNPGLPRDLETICLKCLERVPARRYADAAELMLDLDRFLAHRPIRARPPSLRDRMLKFCRRHRAGVAAVAAVFLVLVASLVLVSWALVQEQRALARTLAAESGEASAHGHAGRMAVMLTSEFGRMAERYLSAPLLLKVTEEIEDYYRQLPPERRDLETRRSHAAALERLAELYSTSVGDRERARLAMSDAMAMRDALAREYPDDAEAAALLIWDQWRYPYFAGDSARAQSLEWREGLIRRLRALHERAPDCLPVKGCLGWMLARHGMYLAHRFGRRQEGLDAVLEGRRLVAGVEGSAQLTADDENHFVRTIRGVEAAVASVYWSVDDLPTALAVQQQCLDRFTRALQADPGNLILREIVADTAAELCPMVVSVSMRRMHDAANLAREHYRLLRDLDPGSRKSQFDYARIFTWEPMWFESQGDYREARRAWAAFGDQLAPLLETQAERVYETGYAGVPLWMAELSVLLGEDDEARRFADLARQRIDAQDAVIGAGAEIAHARESLHLAAIALMAGAWPDRAALVREARLRIGRTSESMPSNQEWLWRQAVIDGLAGVLALREERTAEAAELLQRAHPRLPPTAVGLPSLAYVRVRRLILGAECDALSAMGDQAAARRLAAQLVDESETETRARPDDLAARETLACAMVRLAANLDRSSDADRTRRDDLLRAATQIAHSAKAAGGWQTAEDHRAEQVLDVLLKESRARSAAGHASTVEER